MEWDKIVNIIQNIVFDVKEKCIIQNDAIKDSIFGILENYCTVIYYPLNNEKNRGFHIKKIVKNELKDFVYINTAKPMAEQIFTAAHEFGHIWNVSEKVWKIARYEGQPTKKDEEDITNRFAAELLMPAIAFKGAFSAHMNELGIKYGKVRVDDLVRVIVFLMSDFMVPYEAVRKRLIETGIIQQDAADFLLSKENEILNLVSIFTKDQNTYLGNGTGVKTISGIRTVIESAEKKNNLESFLLIKKIQKEFDIKETTIEENGLEISIGDCNND